LKKLLQISNGVALIITIVINYLSNTGIFGGNTIGGVSGEYRNYFTPAGYAFSIWGLIYLGLIAFVIYQGRSLFIKTAKDDSLVLQIGWWFVISCIANSLWVPAWLYGMTGVSVVLMCLLFFSLIKIVVNTRMELDDVPLAKIMFFWWPIDFYSGWIAVALIANVSAYLTKISWDGFGISEISWAIIMICVAGAVNLFMTWTRNMREFGLVGVWALVAVAVANVDGVLSIFISAIIMSIIVFISSTTHAYKNRKSFPLKF